MTKIEPGWYTDPAAPETQRYWDGEQWQGKPVGVDETPPEHPEPLPEAPPEPEPEPASEPEGFPSIGAVGGASRWLLTDKQIKKRMAGRTLAHPGLRLAARLIDVLIVAVLNAIVNGWFVYQYIMETAPTFQRITDETMRGEDVSMFDVELSARAYQLQFVILLVAILVWYAYEVPSTVNSGQTLGKKALGIKVVPIYAEKLRYGSITSRWSLLMLPLACFPIGMLLAAVDGLWCISDRPFRQCLHDKTPGTMVVLTTTDPPSRGDTDVTDPPRS